MAVASLKYITEEEYLAFENASEVKHEYLRGQIFAMSGGSPEHALITTNVGSELRRVTRDSGCSVFSSDLRVRLEKTGLYTYPDISVVCGKLNLTDHNPPAVKNPTLIVEVLSESTSKYDRGEKWIQYQTLDSLMDYVLVWQDFPRIEHYTRMPGDAWKYTSIEGLEAVLVIESLSGEIPLSEVYRGVEFVAPDSTLRANSEKDELDGNS
jgi:Uma2 family endonuclease